MNETNLFLTVMGFITAALGGLSAWLFRKGGAYNPLDVETSDSPPAIETPPVEAITGSQRIYNEARANMGKKLTLDTTVPAEVGCAQAVSKILRNCGYPIPRKGISTVSGLNKWFLEHGFTETSTPSLGAIISSRTANGKLAHIGICGKTHIMSNTSYSIPAKGLIAGHWDANYTYKGWKADYAKKGADMRYFTISTPVM